MFDKNDPLVASVKKVMEQNAKERAATVAVNEKFGIVSRKALPHERQDEWDAAYKATLNEDVEQLEELKGDQHEIDVDKDKKIEASDLKALRMRKILQRRMGKPGKESVSQSRRQDLEEANLQSIQEEISQNLAEEAYGIYESNGQNDFVAYIDSLSEEQLKLLGMNEEFIEFVINEGIWDSISAGARGAWDAGTLGAGKYVSGAVRHGYAKIKGEKSNYMDQVDKEDQANQKAEKDHPTAYNTGYVGGVAASMLTPGGLAANGAKLVGKAALKAGAKALAKSTAKVTAGTVAVDQVDNARRTRGGAAPAMNEDVEIVIFREELADYLYENFTTDEINSLTEEDLNNIVNEAGNPISNFISKSVSPIVSKAVTATTNYLTKKAAPAAASAATAATAKKTAQTSVNTVKKQAATAAANRFNVAGAAPKATTKATTKSASKAAPKPATKPAANASAAPAATTVSRTSKVLDKIKKNPGKAALVAGGAAVGAAALSSDDNTSDSSASTSTGSTNAQGGSNVQNKAKENSGATKSEKQTTKSKPKFVRKKSAPGVIAKPKRSRLQSRYERDGGDVGPKRK